MKRKKLMCLIIACLLTSLVTGCNSGAEEEPPTSSEQPTGLVISISTAEEVSDNFDLSIDIANVADLDSGQFDVCFDSNVIEVTEINNGSIEGTEIPVDMWQQIDADTVRILFNLPGVDSVTGSGHLATISFAVTGEAGDSCTLELSDGLLVDTEASEITVKSWLGNTVTVK